MALATPRGDSILESQAANCCCCHQEKGFDEQTYSCFGGEEEIPEARVTIQNWNGSSNVSFFTSCKHSLNLTFLLENCQLLVLPMLLRGPELCYRRHVQRAWESICDVHQRKNNQNLITLQQNGFSRDISRKLVK